MGATKDFRVQSSTPATPSPSVVSVYANANSVLLSQVSGSAPIQLGSAFTGAYANPQIQTGMATYVNTGIWFGTAGTTLQTGLATPAVWVPISYNGVQYAVPAYNLR